MGLRILQVFRRMAMVGTTMALTLNRNRIGFLSRIIIANNRSAVQGLLLVTGSQRNNEAARTASFSSPGPTYRNSRIRDDLQNLEAGLPPQESRPRGYTYGNSLTPDTRTRSQTASTASAFSRAGSIVRSMSHRVVNLSGEAEFIEESARREAAQASRQTSRPMQDSEEVELIEESARREAAQASRQTSQQTQDSELSMTFSDISSLSEEAEPVIRRKADPLGAGPNNYAAALPTAPVEKAMRFFGGGGPEPSWGQEEEPEKPPNPLRGNSLGIFSAESRIRNKLCDLLVHPLTEPAILLLIVFQAILLAVSSSQSVYTPGNQRPLNWGKSSMDWTLVGLFIFFTFEVVARIIVSGLVFNAPEYGKRPGKQSLKASLLKKSHVIFKPQRQSSLQMSRTDTPFNAPEISRSFTAKQLDAIRTVEQAQRLQLARRAFLRHSFNRLDFAAVISFWISFVLGNTGIESSYHLYVFRMLSCLRIIRLLALTHGTAVSIYYNSPMNQLTPCQIILRSLKKAVPLLLNVSFFIGFFWLLFAIVGVQSFKSSFRSPMRLG